MEEEKGTFENLSNDKDELTEAAVRNTSSELSSKDLGLEGKINALEQALGQRTSLEILFSQKFSDLRTQLEKEITSRFWMTGVFGTLAVVILGVFGFFGYQTISDSVTRQVDKRFTEPEVNAAVERAIENKAETFVSNKINPLENRVLQLNGDIQSLSANIQEKQNALESAQARLRQMLEVQQMSIGARAGSRADYESLLQLSKAEEEGIRRSAEAAVRDLGYYFSADRHQLTGNRTLLDPKSHRQVSNSVEELAAQLENKDAGNREGAVNLIAGGTKKYFVGRLVQLLSEEPNLRVCARITRALEKRELPIGQLDFPS